MAEIMRAFPIELVFTNNEDFAHFESFDSIDFGGLFNAALSLYHISFGYAKSLPTMSVYCDQMDEEFFNHCIQKLNQFIQDEIKDEYARKSIMVGGLYGDDVVRISITLDVYCETSPNFNNAELNFRLHF